MPVNEKSREDYLRVTTVLYPFSGLQQVDQEILAYAAERGTKVHKICEGIIEGLGEHAVDAEAWGYVQSFKRWWEASVQDGLKVIKVEERFWDDDLQITGQVDLIADLGGSLAIIDLKTSSRPSKTWQPQGCAYAYLAKKAGYDIQKIQFIHLNKHGKPASVLEYPVDDCFFLAILRTYKHFFL